MTSMFLPRPFGPQACEGLTPDARGTAVRHPRTARTGRKRATAFAAGLFAMAAAGATEAQDVFLQCGNNIFSFNEASNGIFRYNQDGQSVGSLCVLPGDERRNYRTERYRYNYTDLRCSVSDAEITVRVRFNSYMQRSFAGNWDQERLVSNYDFVAFRIDRRSGSYRHQYSVLGSVDAGMCEPIERPRPRPARF